MCSPTLRFLTHSNLNSFVNLIENRPSSWKSNFWVSSHICDAFYFFLRLCLGKWIWREILSNRKKCRILQNFRLYAIERPFYLNQLINARNNGFPKVITGLRRCGKSYLLTDIYPSYLRSVGVEEASIIYIPLDDDRNQTLRDLWN